MKKLPISRWITILIFLVGLGSICVLVIRGWNDIIDFPWRLHVGYLVLALGFHSLALGMTFVVWHLMVVRLSGFNDLWINFRAYYLSVLAKRMPTSLFYIGGRLIMYGQVGVSRATIINCILLENILIGIGGILTLIIFLPYYYTVSSFQQTILLALPGSAVVGLLFMRPQLFLETTNRILQYFGKQTLYQIPTRLDILFWTVLYVFPWIFAGLSLYFAQHAVSNNSVGLGMIDAIRISTLTMLIALASLVLPAGFGLKELSLAVLLSSWIPFPTAIAVSIVYRLLLSVDEVIWAIAALFLSSALKQ